MKIKYIQLLIISFMFSVVANCQHQLYFENFEGTTNTFTLNDTIYGLNKGNNMWIVNNVYNGAIGHPTTISEDSTYGGTISYAPHGKYLHIYDSASGFKNDNYNPNDSSVRFAHMTTGICTKALTKCTFDFFYLCEGSPSAFGTVYYSINGGAWTPTGTVLNSWEGDTLKNRHRWQYATINNPAFNNVEDLRLGFQWHNSNGSGKDTTSLGIDDVSMTGIYDSIAHPITCSFSLYGTDSCTFNGPYIFLGATINDSTCASTWDIYMSNDIGNFPGSYAWYQTISPLYGNDIFQYWYLTYPNSVNLEGHCYRFKLERTSYPYLVFEDSICYHFDSTACPPDTIVTMQPPATVGDSVCAGSVIDVPFTSQGQYSTYNVYYCQLIDSIGTTAKIDTIGYLTSNIDYPYNYSPYGPGDIIATIPLNTPPGCNYYLNVVSTTHNRKPYMWGPFCIRHCDIKTNDQQPLQVCLHSCTSQPGGYNDTIVFADSMSHYYNGNKFEVQLLSFMLYPPSMSILNTGLLGVKADTSNGHFKLLMHVPCPDTLFAHGINPGEYYMRIVADSSTYPDSAFGSLIHITIGEPADNLTITVSSSPPGPPYCSNSTLTFQVVPDDQYYPYNSTYEWWFTDKKTGTSPEIGVSGGTLGLNAVADTFLISVQETNNGCTGPRATLADSVVVTGPPNVSKTGPTNICLSDTGTYSIPFSNNTNYLWTISAKAHTDTSNNVLKIKFDTIGTVTIKVKALNICFTDSATWTVHVIATPTTTIKSTPSGALCLGVVDTLKVSGANNYKWSTGSAKTSITVSPTKDTTYWVAGSNQGCTIYDTIKITVIPSPVVMAKQDTSVCYGDSVTLKASGARTYIWSPGAGLTSTTDSIVKAVVTSNVTYKVIGTATNSCKDSAFVNLSNLAVTGKLNTMAETVQEGNSVSLSVSGGSKWLWSPSTGLSCDTCQDPLATPLVTTTYTVMIKDSDGCFVKDTVTFDVNPSCNVFVPDAFSPGNQNKQNTILYVRSECLVKMDFIVYDRWGNKVFESTELNVGWDGNYKGEPMSKGTFVYYVTGTTSDGKTLTRKGNVALVR